VVDCLWVDSGAEAERLVANERINERSHGLVCLESRAACSGNLNLPWLP
jgi:hypothetical protein